MPGPPRRWAPAPAARQCEVDHRADHEGEGHGSDADLAAEEPPDRQHGDLDGGPHDPDLPAGALVQPGHQAVARTGPEARTDVHTGRDGQQHEAAGENEALDDGGGLLRDQPEPELRARSDQEHIEHCAHTRPLADRDPEQQDGDADEVGHQAEGQAGLRRDALRENVPRRDADAGTHHECDRDAVEEEADQKLPDATCPDHARARERRGGQFGHEAIQRGNWTSHKMPIAVGWRA